MKVSGIFGASTASGSMGQVTASHNRGGLYLKQRVVPTNPKTSRQNTVRTLMAQLMVLWSSTLTEAQREAWALYASNVQVLDTLGVPRNITGVNHYVRSNLVILQAGGTRVDAGPTTFTLPEPDGAFALSVSAATNQFSVVFTDTADIWDLADNYMILYCGQPQSAGVAYFGGPWRYAGNFEGAVADHPTTPEVIDLPFVATEGQNIWGYARIALADGRVTNPFRDSCIVAA